MKRPPRSRPADDVAFQSLLADVTPLPPDNRVRHAPVKPRPVPGQRLRDEHETLAVGLSDWTPWDAGGEPGAPLLHVRPGVPAHTLRRLRRGQIAVEAELDLHGMTVTEARAAFAAFLLHCRSDDLRCVRIIHGKGLSSPGGEPVLKKRVVGWLAQREEVLAYCQSKPSGGGSGAVIALLRSAGRREA